MYKISIFIVSLLFSNIYSDDLEIGCESITHNEEKECSEDNLLEEKSYILENLYGNIPKHITKQKTKITDKLEGLSIIYQNKKIYINRFAPKDKSCPPHCISPMNIKNIKTIGELEVLKFISRLE
ncbi:MAG: hypothetical protein KAU90_00770, partial [Sulfurovaceae bacterium]|nr:hypothetical protein [Sulfurovaceae bacterium]